MKTVARYSRIDFVSKEAAGPGALPSTLGKAERAAVREVAMPVRIKVLEIQVPVGNPYDIGTRATLQALRQSGVLTKSGKLGKPFR